MQRSQSISEIRPYGGVIRFKSILRNIAFSAVDDIGLTLKEIPHIEAFNKNQRRSAPGGSDSRPELCLEIQEKSVAIGAV
jgi:hypothetical protein